MDHDDYWTKQIEEWERSKQTQKSFCIEHGLSYTRFLYWRNKKNKQRRTAVHGSSIGSRPTHPQWLPVTLGDGPTSPTPTPTPTPEYALSLRVNHLQLEFTESSDPAWLRQVVEELSKVPLS